MSMAKQGIELSKLTSFLQRHCCTHLADSWDNVGLLVEPSPPHMIDKLIITNDLTEPVLTEAVSKQAKLILSYHPPIFNPLKRLTQMNWKERIVIRCLENHIAVFSPHTGLDAKVGGINDWLLSPFELGKVRPIVPSTYRSEACVHLRIPVDGNFGRFCLNIPVTVLNTDIGSIHGPLAELKCPVEHLDAALQQLQALKIPVLEKRSSIGTDLDREGYGRVGYLASPLQLSTVISQYKTLFGTSQLIVALGNGKTLDDTVQTIGVCAGSGGSIFRQERALLADVLVTGELSHHERLDAVSRGTTVLLAGHSVTERGFLSSRLVPELQSLLTQLSGDGDPSSEISIFMASADQEPGAFI